MQAAILYQLTGRPDSDTLESKLDGEFPAVDVESTRYLDGQTLQHGEAAARISEERKQPMPGHNEIQVEEMERTRRSLVDFYLDLEEGWAGISSQDGEWFVDEWLDVRQGVIGESLEINLEERIEDFATEPDASIWGLTYSVEVADETTRAGSQFHRDADLDDAVRDAEDVSGIGFRYQWDGPARGVLFESGYVAIYKDWDEAQFGRWLTDHVLPYAAYSADGVSSVQTTLGGTADQDATAEGGEQA